MAPTIQAQHVVAVTIPTIAVIFLTYLWYKKRSNSVTRGRSDPGGGGTSKKRTKHRTTVASLPSTTTSTSVVASDQESFPEAMKNAMQKAMRDLETAAPIQEICSDSEENCDQNETVNLISKSTLVGENESTNCVEKISQTENEKNNNNDSAKVEEACENAINQSAAEVTEEIAQKQIQFDIQADAPSTVNAPWENETYSEEVVEENSCELKKSNKTELNNPCCASQRQKSDKSRNIKEKTPPISDNLDVAMQKLESMRIPDKSKRKISTPKRPNLKDSEDKASECEVSRVKSPVANGNSRPSKSQRRKARKKSRKNGNSSNDNNTCKAQTDAEVSTKSACDSNKNFNVCSDRTDENECALRVPVPESEIYFSSRDNDSLRCSINKSNDCDREVENHQENCDKERDSANHSPVDNILDSPLEHFSDARSEGSNDSGKGCSEGAMSPPAGGSSVFGDNIVMLYQFAIAQEHVGKLIGKHGQFINTIKGNSNTRIYIKKHPESIPMKLCALEGTMEEIKIALEMIRNRFPKEAYPDVTLKEFPISLPLPYPLRSELYRLDLIEGVNNDVHISCVVTAGHLFLQQPMHPSYQSLSLLNISMNHYNYTEAPTISKPVKNTIVAAPAMDGWYRAIILSVDESTESCEVRFLDYGGYTTLPTSSLRAVKADFLTLPFQAVECFLANVAPIDGIWCDEAKFAVQGLTCGQFLQAQVFDYTREGIPLVLLYAFYGTHPILINEELVARGFALPVLPNDEFESEDYLMYS